MGRLYLIHLDGRIYSCRYCHSHLANCDELMSKSFHCKHGTAYLFNTVCWRRLGFVTYENIPFNEDVNVSVGPQEERMMTTGMHTVADIFCNCCGQNVGWKYEAAHEKNQKYKEGKFILEREKMIDGDGTDFYLDTHHVGSDADDT